MAITNFTGDENRKREYEDFFCSAEISGGTQKQLMCLSVLNILLSIVAFLGNTLILVALHKESSLHPPSKLLFRNLAATDLCVDLSLPIIRIWRNKFYVVCSIFVDNDWNKRG